MDLTVPLHVREGVLVSELDGDVSLFDGSDAGLVLNRTAAEVWALFGGPRSVRSVVDELAERYGVLPAAIETDVVGVVQQLVDRGVLVP